MPYINLLFIILFVLIVGVIIIRILTIIGMILMMQRCNTSNEDCLASLFLRSCRIEKFR